MTTYARTPGLDALLDALPVHVTLDQLAPFDQFHAGGAEAIDRLLAAVEPGMRVIDFGSGLGGPARAAGARGATVLGIDATAPYVDVARELTRRCGLADRVRFEVGDLTTWAPDPRSADRVLLVHVQMNIEAKQALFDSIARTLVPGGRLLMWEVCSVAHADLPWPLPWSLDGTDSHLVQAAELRATCERAGLTIERWEDRSAWAVEWFGRVFNAPRTGPSLVGLLDRGRERATGFARAVAENRLALIEAVMHA